MSEMKPTRGPWELWGDANPSQVISSPAGFVAQTLGSNDEANARLIAAAGTVFHNTGLSPVQLVEQRDELMAACKKLVEWEAREKDHAIGFMERINLCEAAFQMMYAALAKCEGVK